MSYLDGTDGTSCGRLMACRRYPPRFAPPSDWPRSAVSTARELPRKLVELPVLAASTALQISLRAQQQYAELTARGDEILGQLRGTRRAAAWATFDESPAAEPRSSDRVASGDR